MKIVTFEGLPLVGKSTTGKIICEHFNNKGFNSVYRHGQITENRSAKKCIEKAFRCLEKWDYINKEGLYDFINYRYEQIFIDFLEFINNYDKFSDIDYLFLDRYIWGHNVTASIFGFKKSFQELELQFDKFIEKEILLTCNYEERKKRASIRVKTNNITEYSLRSKEIHRFMQNIHIASSNKNYKSKIISSNSLKSLKEDIIGEIDERISS
ncbi:hypothetical protein ABEV76_06875 [Bacillus subtilis]